MKTLHKIFFCLLPFAMSGQILPLDQYPLEIPNGCHLKDLNNEFEPYVGTWEGTWNNKKITLVISKIDDRLKTSSNGDFHYEDQLYIRYKIINSSNNHIIENNLNVLDVEDAKIFSYSTPFENVLNFMYNDIGACNLLANILLIKNISNPNVLKYAIEYLDWIKNVNCIYNDITDVPINIPKVTINLVKI